MSLIPGGFNQFEFFGASFSSLRLGSLDTNTVALLEATSNFFDAAADYASELLRLGGGEQLTGNPAYTCAPVSAPAVEDGSHPEGSLKADGDVITTPGGYKIEMLGQHEWKITGPDGKTTRIWGDPHVDEGDRDGKADWDFKRNSTFVLGDGTRINVTTVPHGSGGMTVTGQLEVISGNDRVVVSDIDKGKGKIGTVTQDGYQHVNSFQGDVFVMGQESDDWSYTGKEVVGSENGGDSFKLGGELHPRDGAPIRFEGGFDWAMSLLQNVLGQWQNSWQPNRFGTNPYYDNSSNGWSNENQRPYDRRRHMQTMAEAFRAFGQLFNALARISSLSDQLSAGRFNRQMA